MPRSVGMRIGAFGLFPHPSSRRPRSVWWWLCPKSFASWWIAIVFFQFNWKEESRFTLSDATIGMSTFGYSLDEYAYTIGPMKCNRSDMKDEHSVHSQTWPLSGRDIWFGSYRHTCRSRTSLLQSRSPWCAKETIKIYQFQSQSTRCFSRHLVS